MGRATSSGSGFGPRSDRRSAFRRRPGREQGPRASAGGEPRARPIAARTSGAAADLAPGAGPGGTSPHGRPADSGSRASAAVAGASRRYEWLVRAGEGARRRARCRWRPLRPARGASSVRHRRSRRLRRARVAPRRARTRSRPRGWPRSEGTCAPEGLRRRSRRGPSVAHARREGTERLLLRLGAPRAPAPAPPARAAARRSPERAARAPSRAVRTSPSSPFTVDRRAKSLCARKRKGATSGWR